MTDVANPEQLLFASTAQAFLEKEASLGRVRELHAEDVSFETRLVAARRRTGLGQPAGTRRTRRRQRLR